MTKVSFASHPRVGIASAWNWFGKYRPLTLLVLLCVASIPAFSQGADSNPSPSPLVNWGNQPNFLGNFWGARTKLADQDGISFSGFDQNDFFADPSVGNVQLIPNVQGQTGTGDWNRVRGTMDIDMNKFAHIQGSSLHITSTLNQVVKAGPVPGQAELVRWPDLRPGLLRISSPGFHTFCHSWTVLCSTRAVQQLLERGPNDYAGSDDPSYAE